MGSGLFSGYRIISVSDARLRTMTKNLKEEARVEAIQAKKAESLQNGLIVFPMCSYFIIYLRGAAPYKRAKRHLESPIQQKILESETRKRCYFFHFGDRTGPLYWEFQNFL